MIMKQTHIIHKLNIDIDVPDISTARYIYQHFSERWNEQILPELEKQLNIGINERQSHRFEKLNIQLNASNSDQLNESLSITLASEMIQLSKNNFSLTEENSDHPVPHLIKDNNIEEEVKQQVANPEEVIVNSFLYFLQYGQLPWYVTPLTCWKDEEAIIHALIQSNEKNKRLLTKVFSENNKAAERLLIQFDTEFCFAIISIITGFDKSSVKEIINTNTLNKEEILIESKFLNPLLRVIAVNASKIADDNFSFEDLKREHQKQITSEAVIPTNNEAQLSERPFNNAKHDHKEKEDKTLATGQNELYITHGGLILLHPFLQYFFRQFELVTDEDFVNAEAKETGIHLLYYLATSNENPYEHELIFIKYLCGWPQQLPIHRFIKLSEEMKTEAENMLGAVIRHWKILKYTSANGLRESFFQRKGKLILSEQQHKLILEKNAIDILLEHIPWNHSIINLSWMKTILYAEW